MKRYKWTIIFSILTPILLLLVFFLMGGGHGYYSPAIVLFPFGMAGTIFQQSITVPFFILSILQFPFYGLLVDRFKGNITKYCVFLIHLFLAAVVLVTTNFQ